MRGRRLSRQEKEKRETAEFAMLLSNWLIFKAGKTLRAAFTVNSNEEEVCDDTNVI